MNKLKIISKREVDIEYIDSDVIESIYVYTDDEIEFLAIENITNTHVNIVCSNKTYLNVPKNIFTYVSSPKRIDDFINGYKIISVSMVPYTAYLLENNEWVDSTGKKI